MALRYPIGSEGADAMIDLDRFFVAAAIQRRLLDPPTLKPVIEKWNQDGGQQFSETLVQETLVDAKELDVFQRMVRRIIDDNPEKAAEKLQRLTDGAVKAALAIVDDPTVQAYLAGNMSGSGRLIEGRSLIRLLAPCGKGGIGRIWFAHDLMLDRPIALKELRPDRAQNPVMRQRFVREARITGNLQHPGIVPVYRLEGGEDSTDVFYTMRMLNGRTLEQLAAEYHRKMRDEAYDKLALSQLITAFESACQAISYAHAHGIVHRDLKPANIMLGDFGEAVVLDWGLAKRVHGDSETNADFEDSGIVLTALSPEDSDMTQDGQILGTPHYMAPEQAAGRNAEVGVASDIYALGGILFNILTGAVPHRWERSASAKEFLRQIIETEPLRARDIAPRTPAPLDAICAKAMARLPHERYPTVANLIDDIQRWSAGEPVSVYPEGVVRRFVRWTSRRKGTVAVVGGFLFIVLFVATLMLGYGWANANNVIAVKSEELRELAENMSDNTRYMLNVSAEGTRALSRNVEIQGVLLAHRDQDAAREDEWRKQSIYTLSAILETRSSLQTFSLLGLREKTELLRASGPYLEPGARSIVEIEPVPTMKPPTIDAILRNVAQLPKNKVYADLVRPAVREGFVIPGEYPRCRNCYPIVDETGGVIGAFVNDCSMIPDPGKSAFERREEHFAMSTFLANEEGKILYCSFAPDMELERPLRPTDLLTDVFPQLAPLFDPAQPDLRSLGIQRSVPGNQVVFASKVVFEHWQPQRPFIHCSAISRRQVLSPVERRLTSLLLITTAIVSTCLALTWFAFRRIGRPQRSM